MFFSEIPLEEMHKGNRKQRSIEDVIDCMTLIHKC